MATIKGWEGKPRLVKSYWCQPSLVAGWNEINLPFEVDTTKTLLLIGGVGYYPFIKHDSAAYTPPAHNLYKLNSGTQVGLHSISSYSGIWVPLYFLWWPSAVVQRGMTTISSVNNPGATVHSDISLPQLLPTQKIERNEILAFPGMAGAFVYNSAGNANLTSGIQLEVLNDSTLRMHWSQMSYAATQDIPWQCVYWK